MFRRSKKPSSVSADRIRAVVSGGAKLVYQPRKERLATWADCELSWEGYSRREHGVLKDLSDTGARVRFVHRGVMPKQVRIMSPRLRLDRVAEVVWRDETDVGLNFIDGDF